MIDSLRPFDNNLLRYEPGFLACEQADRLFERLRVDLPWQQMDIRLFGRRVPQPRLTAWCADPQVRYRYSGLTLVAESWQADLDRLRRLLGQQLGTPFNSVLANAYRDGRDSMGWHADDEPELGDRPLIASISLGAARRFLLKPRAGGRSEPLDLEHGSLLVMQGQLQRDYLHSVPKTRRPVGWRINLTFRRVLTSNQ